MDSSSFDLKRKSDTTSCPHDLIYLYQKSLHINHITTGKLSQQFTTLQEAILLAQKWLPPISEDDKITIMTILTGTEITYGTSLLRKYIEMLRPYTEILGISGENNRPREADCVASGIVFFYGCLFYIMHFQGWGRHIEDIFLYNLLYILVDHYIDDIRVEPNLKDKAISQMFILIMDPLAYQKLPLIDPILKTIAMTYHRLLTRCPNVKPSVIKLFKAEIDGLSIQKTNNLDRDRYYDIAVRKGGYTMEVLQHIIGNTDPTITEASFQMGSIMQLIDDITDCRADGSNGIHTIATYDLQHENKLDKLWIDIIDRINNIDSRFIIFKILYTIFAVYVPDRFRGNFSTELWSQTTRINLFDYNYGCDGSLLLVHAIMDELSSFEALETIKLKALS